MTQVSAPVFMPTPDKAELLRSLGKLVRGLSAIFWGLPLMLVIDVQTAQGDWMGSLGYFAVAPSLAIKGLLYFGLAQMTSFQKQERVWVRAIENTQLLVFVCFGLSPFLHWWRHLPEEPFYSAMVIMLFIAFVFLVFNLNDVLQRLAAMLPDETLRLETKLFTRFNRGMLLVCPLGIAVYGGGIYLIGTKHVAMQLAPFFMQIERIGLWLLVFLILMPVAMTMALIWKMKEVVFSGVIEAK
jgi:hypothetical protein